MSGAGKAPPWYGGGLLFHCTACGECCSGAPGHVWITAEERREAAALLEMSEAEFSSRFTRVVDGRTSLVERSTGDCVFLTGEKRCRIHARKPRQCVTFPFWPSVLASTLSWRRAAARCPGMGTGERFSGAEIEWIREETTSKEEIASLFRKKRSPS